MIDFVLHTLRSNPETAVFLAIASGVLIGRVQLGKFHLGSVAGALLMGLIIGQVGIEVPSILKSVFFALFIYAVGFKSGPEFFGSLNRGTFKLVIFSVVLCVTGLGVILAMNRVFGFDAGFAAGLGAGALTDTAMMGTASSALNHMSLPAEKIAELNSHMAIAYAVTYLFGTIGMIIFVGTVAPALMKIDLKQSARELEAELAGGEETLPDGLVVSYTRIVLRAHQVAPGMAAVGLTVAELEQKLGAGAVERIIRDNQIIERNSQLTVMIGDILGIAIRRYLVARLSEHIGPEVHSELALSFPGKTAEIVLTQREFANKTLKQIEAQVGTASTHGVFLTRITRQGYEIPLLANTEVCRGDMIEISGRPEGVDELAGRIGRVKTGNYKSDIALHTFGMFLGSLLGLLSAHLGTIPIELGVGGGILLVALVLGWVHSRHPAFGDLPPAAQWAFSEFGLTAFGAVVGLLAGPKALHAMQEHGLSLLIAGAVVTLVPLLVSFWFGRYVLKLHPMILIGALAGAQTEAASMNKIIDETQSQTPVIGFTVCYAISNVLFAVWGPIIVFMS